MAEDIANEVSRAILVLTISSLEKLPSISIPIISATTRTKTRLLIAIFSPSFDNVSRTSSWDSVQKLLTHAYVQSTSVAQKHGKILMGVDILLRGVKGTAAEDDPVYDWDTVFCTGDIGGVPLPSAWSSLPRVHLPTDSQLPTETSRPSYDPREGAASGFPVVALGGTFDHLHAGHKILLSMAAWIAEEKIIVGVTDDALLVKKVHKEILEPITTRVDCVRNFLRMFKPGLTYDVVPIVDVYGPTAWDINIQALVVSKETQSGAASIASLRSEKGLPPLKTFVIDVISSSSANLDTDDPELLRTTKMSSTFIRQWIHGQKNAPSDKEVTAQRITNCA